MDAVRDVGEVIKLIAEARCDVAVSDLEFPHPELATLPLRRTKLMAVFPPGTELRGPVTEKGVPDLQAAHLEGHTLVTLPRGTLTRKLTDECYDHLDARPRRVVTTSQRDALVSFALRGVGVTFVPDVMARDSIAAGAVIATCDRPRARTIGLVHRRSTATPKLRAFVDTAVQTMRSGATARG